MAYTTIDDPEAYFQTRAYTGNGSADTAITFDGDTDLEPDLLWIKRTDSGTTFSHLLFDAVRGITKRLLPNSTAAESTESTIASFNSDGWTMDADTANNADAGTYAAWCWKESADAGFDIVSYTGDGNASRTISHSLSAVPHMMIIKERGAVTAWIVYHHKNTAAPETDYLLLNGSGATDDYADYFDDTAPTSSVFTVDTAGDINGSSDTYISYLWTSIQGFSKFGGYEGNGNADGPFIWTGFKPAYVLIKNSGRASTSWTVYDNKRPGYNSDNAYVLTDATDAEASDKDIDLYSNGFKPLLSNNAVNTSGDTYIYMAFAEAPFVNSNGVPCNAR